MIRMIVRFCVGVSLASCLPVGMAQDVAPSAIEIRSAVVRAIPLIEKGAAGSMKERPNCFTCHNLGMPVLAIATARSRGFSIDDSLLKEQLQFTADYLEDHRDDYLAGKGTGGQVATAGAALWALETGGRKPDEITAAVAEYLLKYQKDLGRWKMTSDRPPTESSHFTVNFLAIRGLNAFATPEQRERAQARIAQARDWAQSTPAKETEDRVFRLWSLKIAGAGEEHVSKAASELKTAQRPDGGWAQRDDMESDAYATGSALVALFETGTIKPTDEATIRGLKFLLKSQRPDGSWYVKSRSKPFQTYYESGFPHGKDQFVSIAASSWATAALALASSPLP
ncbi:hypothetical protein GC170_18345 [bacterium]|nr:hypothetical protein [bacterium]